MSKRIINIQILISHQIGSFWPSLFKFLYEPIVEHDQSMGRSRFSIAHARVQIFSRSSARARAHAQKISVALKSALNWKNTRFLRA